MTQKHLLLFALFGLMLTLACGPSVTLVGRPTIPPPPTLSPLQVNTAVPSNNQPAPTVTPAAGQAALPTFTPRSGNNARPVATATIGGPAPTNTPAANAGGPLTFGHSIEWRLNPDNPGQAIATITISPSGGDGTYKYFRDELPVTGPRFEYNWATCSANPGSLRVTSGDGQTVKIDYYEKTPCP